jgi:hypothetical protein
VLAAAQGFIPDPHVSWHAPPVPHATLQVAAPEQSTVHPPSGHATSQPLWPPQVTVVLVPTERWHVVLPAHDTVLPLPDASVHVLPPAHVDVHCAPQVPEHADWPAHVVVQPVPQSTAHVFLELQSYVTPLGAAPASPPEGPSAHEPPDWHVQVEPEHAHAPLQARAVVEGDAPLQANARAASTTPAPATNRWLIMIAAPQRSKVAQVQPVAPLHAAPLGSEHGTPLQQSLVCAQDWP